MNNVIGVLTGTGMGLSALFVGVFMVGMGVVIYFTLKKYL